MNRVTCITRILALAALSAACALAGGCADRFPGDQIGTPQHCTEISVPATLKESFMEGMEPGQKASFRCYSTTVTFAAVSASVLAQVSPQGYKFDDRLFLRKTDREQGASEYFVAYTKRGGKYFVAVADLADLRSRGEEIEGTADFLVICGMVKKKRKAPKQTGEEGAEPGKDSPGYVEL